jgi:hypothetical protein
MFLFPYLRLLMGKHEILGYFCKKAAASLYLKDLVVIAIITYATVTLSPKGEGGGEAFVSRCGILEEVGILRLESPY